VRVAWLHSLSTSQEEIKEVADELSCY